jgi:hypothetical protein
MFLWRKNACPPFEVHLSYLVWFLHSPKNKNAPKHNALGRQKAAVPPKFGKTSALGALHDGSTPFRNEEHTADSTFPWEFLSAARG